MFVMKEGKHAFNIFQNDYIVFIQIIFTPNLEIVVSNRGRDYG